MKTPVRPTPLLKGRESCVINYGRMNLRSVTVVTNVQIADSNYMSLEQSRAKKHSIIQVFVGGTVVSQDNKM